MMGDVAAVTVRPMQPDDWPSVRSIYAAGIATGNATFETTPPTWDEWDAGHRYDLRYVAVNEDLLVGWTAVTDVSDRCCYAGVVENSVYVDPDYQGQRIGRTLLDTLVAAAASAGIWTIQTGIFPENQVSVALHQACGFRIVGRRERIGQLAGTWRDVLLLERRNPDPS
jgi:L-amino acid N-acyltransferase YncA